MSFPFKSFLILCVFVTWMTLCLPAGFLLRSWIGDMPEYATTWERINNVVIVHIPFTPVPGDIFFAFFGALLFTSMTFLLLDTQRAFGKV